MCLKIYLWHKLLQKLTMFEKKNRKLRELRRKPRRKKIESTFVYGECLFACSEANQSNANLMSVNETLLGA